MTDSAITVPLLRDCRRIFFRDLVQMVHIGIHDFERAAAQRILFNIDLFVSPARRSQHHDHISEVVDYDFVREAVSRLVTQGHIGLQETLCDAVLDAMLSHPHVIAARVSTRKPDVFEDCAAVGVEVFRFKI
jgi:dihydroneopterin aldolase